MGTFQVVASARIEAAPARVYAVIADYRHARRRILPDAFRNLAVERGGVGAGTVVRFEMQRAGRTRSLRAAVTEPEPGRVLVETHLDGPMAATSFTVEPSGSGAASTVTVATALATGGGPLGMLERFLATRRLRTRYKEELRRLGNLVARMESAPALPPTHRDHLEGASRSKTTVLARRLGIARLLARIHESD